MIYLKKIIDELSKNHSLTHLNIEAIFLYSECGLVGLGAGHKAKRLVLYCIKGVSSNTFVGEQKIVSSKI